MVTYFPRLKWKVFVAATTMGIVLINLLSWYKETFHVTRLIVRSPRHATSTVLRKKKLLVKTNNTLKIDKFHHTDLINYNVTRRMFSQKQLLSVKPITFFAPTTQQTKNFDDNRDFKYSKSSSGISRQPKLTSVKKYGHHPAKVKENLDKNVSTSMYSQKRDYAVLTLLNNKCEKDSLLDKNRKFDHKNDIFVLIVIKSMCILKERRDAIRSTWGNEEWAKIHLNINIRRVFLLGACDKPFLQNELIKENNKHQDILQWDFFESFQNLTLKQCLFLEWFTTHCQNVPYIFQGDDDVFVNVKLIVKTLKNLTQAQKEQFFLGSILKGNRRITDRDSKYFVSSDLYAEDKYPPYASGGGFVMSRNVAVRLYQASLTTRKIPIDDAFIGILLKKINVKPQQDPTFKSWGLKKYSLCRLAKIYTFHKMLPTKLKAEWKAYVNLNISLCGSSSDDVFKTRF